MNASFGDGSPCVKEARLLSYLEQARKNQEKYWKAWIYPSALSKTGKSEVNGYERDIVVGWLVQLHRKLHLQPETVAVAVEFLDRFLHAVKVQYKYLRCVGVTCLFLAAKTFEEDDVVPGLQTYVRATQCGFTVAEVLRMERIVLEKLGWNLQRTTTMSVIQALHALLLCKCPHLVGYVSATSSRQLAILTERMFAVMSYHASCCLPPTLLALALLSLELEQVAPPRLWFPVADFLQLRLRQDTDSLIKARELIGSILLHVPPCRFATKRKVDMLSDDSGDESNMYDGIKHLYSEGSEGLIDISGCGQKVTGNTPVKMATISVK